MPIGVTHYYLRDDGTLRHGHTNGQSDKEQWHNADVYHRSDPDGHERDHAWREPGYWSDLNYMLSHSERQHLIRKAHYAHDKARYFANVYNGYSYLRPNEADYFLDADAQPAPVDAEPTREELEAERDRLRDKLNLPPAAPSQPPAPTPPAPNTNEDDEESDRAFTPADDLTGVNEQLALLDERVGNIEELALAALAPVTSDIKNLQLGQEAIKLNATHLEASIAGVKAQLGDIDVSKQLEPMARRLADAEQAIEAVKQLSTRYVKIEVVTPRGVQRSEGLRHEKFEQLIELATKLSPQRRNIWLAGPAGSGKTTAAEQLAELLGLPFEYIGAIDSPYKLSGHYSATGVYLSTAFRRRYEQGGVILLDEVDGSAPGALLEINAALANHAASFPDGMVRRHPDTIVLCAANTWGFGGDANYVGRVRLDAAFLNRFAKISWGYDESLERLAAGGPSDWVDAVQATRRLIFARKEQFICSPRASITGCELLRGGVSADNVADAIFGDYRQHQLWPVIGKPIEDYVAHYSAAPAPTPTPTNNRLHVDFSHVPVR